MAIANQSQPLPLPWHLPHSHNEDLFASSLQELKNLRPLLHSAAEYYEVAYLHSNQKKTHTVIQSLQDYCAKVLVKSVDHLGTVASHLDECLSLLAAEICNVDVRTACITTRLSACHEKMISKGLAQCQQMRSRRPVYRKHYDSKGTQLSSLPQLSPGKLEEIFQANAGSDSSTLKSLSWYLACESSSSLSVASKRVQVAKRATSLEGKNESFNDQAHFARSLSSGQTPRCNQTFNPSVKVSLLNPTNSLGSLLKMDVMEHEQETTFCKVPFISFLGKTKGEKCKSLDLAKQ